MWTLPAGLDRCVAEVLTAAGTVDAILRCDEGFRFAPSFDDPTTLAA
jgi:hypothetical protein